MFVGLRYNNRGNYSCEFCNHKSWKSESYGITHVESKHPLERAKLLAEKLKEAQSKPPRIEYKERVVYKDPPKKEYRDEYITIYCPTCRMVQQNVRLPARQSIDDTPHSHCGRIGLQIVTKLI